MLKKMIINHDIGLQRGKIRKKERRSSFVNRGIPCTKRKKSKRKQKLFININRFCWTNSGNDFQDFHSSFSQGRAYTLLVEAVKFYIQTQQNAYIITNIRFSFSFKIDMSYILIWETEVRYLCYHRLIIYNKKFKREVLCKYLIDTNFN